MHAAQLAGNADKAKDLDQRAQEAVKAAAQVEGIAFPALPEKLHAALPAPTTPAAPATAPTTEPSAATAPTASAADASPDEQAVRAVLISFADAIDKGDIEAARALCQIEPGQDQALADIVKLFASIKDLHGAVSAKFGDQAAPLLAAFPDASKLSHTGKITIKGDDAFVEGLSKPDAKRGEVVRVNGQWKILVGAPQTDEEKKEAEMAPKMAAALTTLSNDTKAGKYATLEDFAKALQAAVQGLGG